MGRKRKGAGALRGAVQKQRKVVKKAPDKSDNNKDILAIKMSLKTVVREEWHDTVIPWITKKSIQCTHICELASLLFLHKVRTAHENGDYAYFGDGDGIHIIEECFFAVISKNVNDLLMPEFRAKYDAVDGRERMAWPNNEYFGNLMKYIPQEYTRNVITNLTTHRKKRLTQFFRYCVYCENVDNVIGHFDETDVKNAVSWAIKRYDSTRGNAERLRKRNYLLRVVRQMGGPDDDDVTQFTHANWFQSIPMWLTMQKFIDEFHDWSQRNGFRVPKIKNLSVIPICSHMRKCIKFDADALYRMMCETGTIPMKDGKQVTVGFICANKEYYFNYIFNMDAFNRLLKANKEFHYFIVTDGVAASILYKVPKKLVQQLSNDDLVKRQYMEGFYVYLLGIDPGMKTWNATTRRHIDTGKEVNDKFDLKLAFFFLLNAFHCFMFIQSIFVCFSPFSFLPIS